MIRPHEVAYKVRVKLNDQFVEKCLGDKYLREEPIIYIRDGKVYNDGKSDYVHISGKLNSGYAYLNQLDLEFNVDGNGIPIENSVSREQADALLREFRVECLPFGEYPDIVLNDFLNKRYQNNFIETVKQQ